MTRASLAFLLTFLVSTSLLAQTPWSERMAKTMLTVHRDSITVKDGKPATWDYEQGLLLLAMERLWHRTGDGAYFRYIQKNIDSFVDEKGTIRTYALDEFNLDNVTPGRALLLLHTETGRPKYRLAAEKLREQLRKQPRLKEGGFWHKQRYPAQMWLDGLYMAQPFLAEYAQLFGEPATFDDVINQFVWMEKNTRDPKTGLLLHAYDESRQQRWADPKTGRSPNFWGRSIGWYAMALLDVLDYVPQNHPRRGELVQIFQRLAPAILNVQDKKTGGWYQLLTLPNEKGNYLESSATAMFVYALAKGHRLGLLDARALAAARRGHQYLTSEAAETDEAGLVHLTKTVSVGGLGGTPYRDGSVGYYLSEPQRRDDLKGVAPFILASIELEMADEVPVGRGKKVVLDYFFNHEFRKGSDGQPERYHYTWEDRKDSGYWLWGRVFQEYGAKLDSLAVAPTAANLKDADVFILVDPDTPKETANPNSIEPAHVKALADWVRAGGTLVLLANDSSNTELTRFNTLAKAFGIEFKRENLNRVPGKDFSPGKVLTPANHPIFGDAKTLFIKEFAGLSLQAPARPVLQHGPDVVMAVADVGRGRVFALGDPWIYNEYLNGKRLPAEYQNFPAAKALTRWLLAK
jgi:unsaturated rhamnogalacturonyl hydrolase